MVPPHLLLGCALLFWGWQSQLWFFAIVMAVVLEASRWLEGRLALTEKDFNQLADLSSLLLVIVAIYLFTREAIHGLFTLLNWLPILLFPLITAQTYSHSGAVKLSSLFISLRHTRAHTRRAQQQINLHYPYILIILLATSVNYHPTFFLGVCLLTLLALWEIRPHRYSRRLWLSIVTVTLLFAYLNQQGLYHLQTYVENMMVQWFDEMLWADRDPYRQMTALGDMGELKQSNRIIARVVSPYPILLREASYNSYFKKTWRAKGAGFTMVTHDPQDQTVWPLADQPSQVETIQITTTLNQGKGMLSLPNGTYQLLQLPVLNLQRNDFGAVKVEDGPEFIEYQVNFGEGTPLDAPPTEQDLIVPVEEKEVLDELVTELQLRSQSPQQMLITLQNFFYQRFGYSLNLAMPSRRATPLENFLRYQRAGHCEYFATATALLLRAAGIPSRYVAGYAAEEFSSLEQAYLIRKRHAHAWTLVYLNGQWHNVDNTPPTWNSLEQENASWWQPLYDLWAWLSHQLTRWRWQNAQTSNHWFVWFIIPLGLALAWRLYLKRKVTQRCTAVNLTVTYPGTESEFFKIAHYLTEKGYLRLPGETLCAWFNRIHLPELEEPEIQLLLQLHRRYRFDPHGTTVEEKRLLNQSVQSWLKKRVENVEEKTAEVLKTSEV